MLLTLLRTGQQIDWDPETDTGRQVHLSGRDRFIAAQQTENQRSLRPQAGRVVTLSATSSDAVDLEGSKKRAQQLETRREILRKRNETWLADQKRRPGPPTFVAVEKFRLETEAELAAAGVGDVL